MLIDKDLKQVFDEFKKEGGHEREYFNFIDFERTIRKFNLQLMPNLTSDDPDFGSLCMEMYSLISISSSNNPTSTLYKSRSEG